MAEGTVGQIQYDARIDTSNLARDASSAERIVGTSADTIASHGARGFGNFASQASNAFGSVADGIQKVATVSAAVFLGGALGIGKFVQQASELQGIRASFESMTGSAEEATKVLGQLNKFSFETAFSSMDINNAARQLLGAGATVDSLGKKLKDIGDVAGATGANLGQLTLPISQAMARGVLQTQDYYQILNSGAGKLGQVLREEVAQRGLGNIGDALSQGKVTADILFETMSKAAAEGGFAFEGAIKQSKTFSGQMSNLQETIGNVALRILGVDKASGAVKAGGVFDKISKAVAEATKWLNKNQGTIEKVAGVLINNAVPALSALVTMFVLAKTAAIGFAISAGIAAGTISLPFLLGAAAITAVVGALVFLQVKFNIFGKALEWVRDTFTSVSQTMAGWFEQATTGVGEIIGVMQALRDKGIQWVMDRLADFQVAWEGLQTGVQNVVAAITGFIEDNKTAIKNWAIVIGTILAPAFIKAAAQAVVSATTAGLAWIVQLRAAAAASGTSVITMVADAVKVAVAHTIAAGQAALAWIKNIPAMVASMATFSAQAVVTAVRASAAFVLSSVTTGIAWARTFASFALGVATMAAQAVAAGIRMGVGFMLALGPIGLIVTAVLGAAALIVANWDTVKGWFEAFWTGVTNMAATFVDWLSRTWPVILAIITGPIGLATLAIVKNWDTIKAAFSAVIGFFSGVFTGAWHAITNAFSSVGSFFRGIWNDIVSIFGNIGTAIGDGIGGAFKSVVNTVLNFAASTINGFINAINKAIGAINKVPGVNISKIATMQVPKLAEGGIVPAQKGGIIANIGEGKESEAVIPLSKLDAMLNTPTNGPAAAGIVYNINMSGVMTSSPADERTIARRLLDRINEEQRARGHAEIGVA